MTNQRDQKSGDVSQMDLPGIAASTGAGKRARDRSPRIPHAKILFAIEAAAGPGSIVEIYRTRVMPVKTRTIKLLGRKSSPTIITTLLGYEVKAAYKRVHCPDMATARYLKLFTEIGCHTIRLPYDPTVTAALLPSLEACLEMLKQGVSDLYPHQSGIRTYVLQRIIQHVRQRLAALRPPEPLPEVPEDREPAQKA